MQTLTSHASNPGLQLKQRRALIVALGLGIASAVRPYRSTAATYTPGRGLDIAQYTRPGFAAVNSYVVAGAGSAAILDCQRTGVEALQLVGLARGIGKPIDGIFLSHEHPDHIAGLAVVADAFPAAPIYALESTRRFIETSSKGLLDFMRKRFGDAMPDRIPLPTRIVRGGDRVQLAGVEWLVEESGLSESENIALLFSREHEVLFAADVVGDRVTPWLVDGHTAGWLRSLRALRTRYSKVETCLPGHGAAGPAATLMDSQIEYLEFFRRLVQKELNGRKKLDEAAKTRVRQATMKRYPGYVPVAPSNDLIGENAVAVAAELVGK